MKLTFQKVTGIILMLFSTTGIIASLALSIERINLLKDANAVLSCSINSAFSCASVMTSPQAEILGFPNPLIGLIGFSMVFVYGLFLYFFKERNKIVDLAYFLGILGAFIFSYWLLYESVFVIKSLCIYCLLSCFSATNMLFAHKLLLLKDGIIKLKSSFNEKIQTFISKQYYFFVIGLWYLIVIALVYIEFKDRFV